jgi:trimeric autotransporter adhesin
LAHSSRTWTGARTPQAQKRVRQAARRHAVLQPRRSAAKTHVKTALLVASDGDAARAQEAVINAVSALDRAAKVGAIHPNAAARRKSRLMLSVNAALGGEALIATGKVQRQVSKAAATKAAKARIAAGKASKAKGEQTAAGKARAALSRTTRETGSAAAPAGTEAASGADAAKAPKATAAKGGAAKATTAKATTAKPAKATSKAEGAATKASKTAKP